MCAKADGLSSSFLALSLSLSLSLPLSISLSLRLIGMIISLWFDPSPTMSNLYYFPSRSLKDLLSSEKKYCTTGTTRRHDLLLLLLLCTNNATCYVKSQQHLKWCIMLEVRVCNMKLRYVFKCKSANKTFFTAKHVNANFPVLTRSVSKTKNKEKWYNL